MAFVESGEEDFIQGGHDGDIGTAAIGVLQWGRDWTQFQIQHKQMGTYSQGIGWESGCRKSLRGNIGGEWGVLPKPSYQDSC